MGSKPDTMAAQGAWGADPLSIAEAVWLSTQMSGNAGGVRAQHADAAEDRYKLVTVSDPVPAERESFVAQITSGPADAEAGEFAPDEALTPIRPAAPASAPAAGTPRNAARVGALASLAAPAMIGRALRSFRARHAARSGQLDESATVDDFVESGCLMLAPKMERGSRRWLRISLVVEASPSNAMWSQPIDELEALMKRSGAFRQVRRWALEGDRNPTIRPPGDRHFNHSRHLATFDWWRHEIVLMISDFTSEPWWLGSYAPNLRKLAASQPLALLHTLPPRLWMRSWAGVPDALLRSAAMACPTVASSCLPTAGAASGGDRRALTIPILGLDAGEIASWAGFVMGNERAPISAVMLEARVPAHDEIVEAAVAEIVEVPKPYLQAMAYNMASTALARQLAQLMSIAAPLTFPVMRWVQQAVLPQSDASHLAEFVLGGLLEQVAGDANTKADDVVYDFVDGVRAELQTGMPITHALEVLRTVGAFLEANQHATIDQRTGVATWPDEQLHTLEPNLRAFALVSRAFLSHIGIHAPGIEPARRASTAKPVVAEERKPPIVAGEELATHSRRLSNRVIDLLWSPDHKGVLAVVQAHGVEVWNTQTEQRGVLIGRDSTPADDLVLTLFWVAGKNWMRNVSKRASMRAIVGRVADGLRAAGASGVRIVAVASFWHLSEQAPALLKNATVLVFQIEDRVPETESEIAAASKYMEEFNVTFATIFLDWYSSGSLTPYITLDLSEFHGAHQSASDTSSIAEMLERFVWSLSTQVVGKCLPPSERVAVTAACWLDGGRLAIAEQRGERSVIYQAGLDNFSKREAPSSAVKTLLQEQSQGYVRKMYARYVDRSEISKASKNSEATSVSLSYIDNSGSIWFGGGKGTETGIDGMLASGSNPSVFAFCNRYREIELVSNEGKSLKRNTFKLGQPKHSSSSRASAPLMPPRVLQIGIGPDTVYAVTSSGLLQSSAGELRERSEIGGTSDDQSKSLLGSITAAGFSADSSLLCVTKTNGAVELWNTATRTMLDAVNLRPRLAEYGKTVIALSPDGQFCATSNGRYLNIFRIDQQVGQPFERHKPGASFAKPDDWMGSPRILWVDDNPRNNTFEREEFRRLGVRFTLALSTATALRQLKRNSFTAIITDMGRREGPREGYVLLDALRAQGDDTPVFIYARSNALQHKAEASVHSGQGSTNNFSELRDMVMKVVNARRSSSH